MAKKVKLKKIPKNPIIIEGFPGFGLVATIATGFLIDHLECEKIGNHWFEDQTPTLAIHKNEAIDPIGIYYNKKYNVIIVQSVTSAKDHEWKFADFLLDLANQTQAKEIISVEGVGAGEASVKPKGFYYTTKMSKKLEKLDVQGLGEGIIVGVSSALLLKADKTPITCMFAETHSKLPDSKAAARIIEMLDQYLGLKVDYKPLLKQAKEFEAKLKEMLTKQQEVQKTVTKKDISYLG